MFFVERSIEEDSPARNNTPAVLSLLQLSGAKAMETLTISSVASLEPQVVYIDSDSNEPTFPFGFGSQYPKVTASFNGLNVPLNPINVMATMAMIRIDQEYCHQSSTPSPISTTSMNVSTIEGWETTQGKTEDANFYSEDEPRRVYWEVSSSETLTLMSQDMFLSHRALPSRIRLHDEKREN